MKIWELKYFSDEKDIVFKVDDKIYELNKYILNISPVLKKIISNQFTEANEEIKEINILHKEQWEIFLNYVYYRYCLFLDYEYGIELIKELNKNQREFNIDNLSDIETINLYYSADILVIQGLKEKLEVPLLRILKKFLQIKEYDTFNDIFSIVPDYLIDDFIYSINSHDLIFNLIEYSNMFNNLYISKRVKQLLDL